MSRLKEALEKAMANARSENTGVTLPPPAEMVPPSWQFSSTAEEIPAVVAPVDPAVAAVQVKAAVEQLIAEAPMMSASPVIAAPAALDLDLSPADLELSPASVQVSAEPVEESGKASSESHPEDDIRPSLPVTADPWKSYKFGRGFQEKAVVGPQPNMTLVEQYRRLGAALHHHQLQGGARTVMIASAAPAEGKSLTATNLALTLSESYQRQVLLIDADLRRPSIHDLLQVPSSPGLSECLMRSQQGSFPIHRISANLSLLTAGRPSSDPMSGLVSATMNQILSEAAQRFDWVIVDTPPVALLPDANLLAAMIDTALLVVSANATPYPLITRAIQAIGEQRILGVVLNRIAERELVSPYNYYGDWYKGYGDPAATTKKKKKKRLVGLFRKRGQEETAAV
jgi:protein-tyrosine kinase